MMRELGPRVLTGVLLAVLLAVASILFLFNSQSHSFKIGEYPDTKGVRLQSQQLGTSFTLAGMIQRRFGDAIEYSDYTEITYTFESNDQYRIDSSALASGGQTTLVVSNSLTVNEAVGQGGNGRRLWIADVQIRPPSFFDPRSREHPATVTPLARLFNDEFPKVLSGDVSSLIATEAVTDVGTELLLGRSVSRLRVNDVSNYAEAADFLVDQELDIKLSWDRVRFGGSGERFVPLSLTVTQSIDPTTFELDLESGEIQSEYVSRRFDLQDGFPYPVGSEDVTTVPTDTLSAFDMDVQKFIDHTWEVHLASGSSLQSGWAVVSEIYSDTLLVGSVIQAPEQAVLPQSSISPYWPGEWLSSSPENVPGSIFVTRTSHQLSGGTQIELLGIRDPLPQVGRPIPQFKYAAVWAADDVQWLVLCTSDVGGEADVLAILEELDSL